MWCVPLLDKVDERRRCVCLRWRPEDEMDYKIEGSMSKKRKFPETEEWFGMELFSINRGSVHVVRLNIGIAPFRSGLHCPENRFSIK